VSGCPVTMIWIGVFCSSIRAGTKVGTNAIATTIKF
jgi:hypothetical protein